MEEMVFIYFLNAIFIISIIKSIFKGGTSEIISILFLNLSFFSAFLTIHESIKSILTSIFIFLIIYNLGLFLSYLFKSSGLVQKIFGFFFGIIKFFTFLMFTTTIALFIDSTPKAFTNHILVKIILPYSEILKQKLINYKNP